MLPHAYPFRFIDTEEARGGSLRIELSSNADFCRGGSSYPTFLAIEIAAQAAMVLLARDAAEGGGEAYLAGVDEAQFSSPLAAGEELRAEAELLGRFGRMIKARVRLLGTQGVVAECGLLLARV